MVDSNVSLASPNEAVTVQPEFISSEEAAQNVAFLRSHAESWLAVFFNVFGSVGRDGRAMVGDVISAWAAIAGEQVCNYNLISLITLV
jgi:ribosomal RNA-processing protein 12